MAGSGLAEVLVLALEALPVPAEPVWGLEVSAWVEEVERAGVWGPMGLVSAAREALGAQRELAVAAQEAHRAGVAVAAV